MSGATRREQIKYAVKEAADIVQVVGEVVELRRAGTRLTGLCPFHSEKTPSFTVNPQGQFYHCFGCGEHGDVFAFVMQYHHLEFPEALKLLAQKYGIEMDERQLTAAEQEQLRRREQLYAANETAAQIYQRCLLDAKLGKVGRTYLEQRGVPAQAIERYRLGWAPDPEMAGWQYLVEQLRRQHLGADILEQSGLAVAKESGGYYDRFRSRVMFPLIDMTGRVVAFGGRILGEGKPKYLNSPESPIFAKSRLLFGLYPHRDAIRRERRAIVVEGNFDMLLLAVHGHENVVAPLGTALTREHIHSLRSYSEEVVLLFDADAAGLKAAMRSIPLFLSEQVAARVALLPAGQDPDSYVRAEGPEAVTTLIKGARPLAEFAFDALVHEHGLTLSGKSRIVEELKTMLASAADQEQRTLMISHFSQKLGVSPGYFQGGQKPPTVVPTPILDSGQGAGLANLPRQERQLLDFLVLYPESYGQLQAAGLSEALREPAAVRLLTTLEQAMAAGPCRPESFLEWVTEPEERQYIVEVLTKGWPHTGGEGAEQEQVRQMLEELVRWLTSRSHKQAVAVLQEQINHAERLGNITLLMDLIRQKQEIEKKRRGF